MKLRRGRTNDMRRTCVVYNIIMNNGVAINNGGTTDENTVVVPISTKRVATTFSPNNTYEETIRPPKTDHCEGCVFAFAVESKFVNALPNAHTLPSRMRSTSTIPHNGGGGVHMILHTVVI